MTSVERHEARYQRRKARRLQKKQEAESATFDEVMSYSNLCDAGRKCCNNVRWKTSTQNFEMNLLSNCQKIYEQLQNETWKFKGFKSFTVYERGKLRYIDSIHIEDRCVQKCLCRNYLLPVLYRSSIYDNGACVEGKGIKFAIDRLKKHLHDHYKKYGTKGGIYQFDFTNYFNSIPHDKIKERIRDSIHDDKLYSLFCELVDEFNLRMPVKNNIIQKGYGVGLGSEVSQSIAIMYASPIDHYIKDTMGIKGYARFSDDGYVISDSIEQLKDIQRMVHKLADELGLKINNKKDMIKPFHHQTFHFLKMRFQLRDNGTVLVKSSRQSVKRIRHRLKKFRRWVDNGTFDAEDVFTSYQSWRAYMRMGNNYNILHSMDRYFVRLFRAELARRRLLYPCTLKAIKQKNKWIYINHNRGQLTNGAKAIL